MFLWQPTETMKSHLFSPA